MFEGVFKAVYIETDEQLVHLTRYIYLNPVASSLVHAEELGSYPWSSYPAYRRFVEDDLIAQDAISSIHSMVSDYEGFIKDQIAYTKEIEKIKHLTFD